MWTEYGEIRIISPYSVRIRENADQNNFEYLKGYEMSFITSSVLRQKCSYSDLFWSAYSGVFIINFGQISHIVLVFPLLTSKRRLENVAAVPNTSSNTLI